MLIIPLDLDSYKCYNEFMASLIEKDNLWDKVVTGKSITSVERDIVRGFDPEYLIQKIKEGFLSINTWFALAENQHNSMVALCASYATFLGLDKSKNFSEVEARTMITEWLDLPYALLVPSLYSKKFPISVLLEKQTYSILDAKVASEASPSGKAAKRKIEINRTITNVLEAREEAVAQYLRDKLAPVYGDEIKSMPDKWILKAFGAYTA